MTVRFRAAAGTHLGTVRMNNEDSAVVSDQLLVLADGMGGHAAGEVASVLAVRVFSEVDHAPGADLDANLLEAGRQTRRALVAMSDADPVLESLGTTLLAVVSDGEKVVIGHLGDSRVYVLREDAMYQITTDHTHVQRMVDQGQLTPDQARTHPYRAMLLKSLDDHSPGPDLDIIDVSLQPGDRLLLCSDGLSDYLTADQIGQALATEGREGAVEALIDSALRASTRDNVTVVVADVEVEGAVADDAEAEPDVAGEPLTPPGYAGAVLEGIRLSEPAAEALGAALPGLVLDPDEPWRGSTLLDDAPQDGAPADLETPREAGAASPVAAPAGATAATVDAATPGATAGTSGATGRPGGTGAKARESEWAPTASADKADAPPATPADDDSTPPDPAAPDALSPHQPSTLPGVLAGAFVIAVLALLALFLFG